MRLAAFRETLHWDTVLAFYFSAYVVDLKHFFSRNNGLLVRVLDDQFRGLGFKII